jgi:hypothetical protein
MPSRIHTTAIALLHAPCELNRAGVLIPSFATCELKSHAPCELNRWCVDSMVRNLLAEFAGLFDMHVTSTIMAFIWGKHNVLF